MGFVIFPAQSRSTCVKTPVLQSRQWFSVIKALLSRFSSYSGWQCPICQGEGRTECFFAHTHTHTHTHTLFGCEDWDVLISPGYHPIDSSSALTMLSVPPLLWPFKGSPCAALYVLQLVWNGHNLYFLLLFLYFLSLTFKKCKDSKIQPKAWMQRLYLCPY